MRLKYLRVFVLSMCGLCGAWMNVDAQIFAVKTSLPALITTNLNVGLEVAVAPKFTIEAHLFANPWKFNDRYGAKLVGLQPGARYWFKDTFAGSFIGAHAGVGAGTVTFKAVDYQGYFLSGGVSYGYAWVMGVRWNLEGELGLGYYNLQYRTRTVANHEWTPFRSKSFIAPSKLSVNLVYLF